MPWRKAGLTISDLAQAMANCDKLGLDAFRTQSHEDFQAAKNKYVELNGRGPYEARPLISAAHSIHYPHLPKLGPSDFQGSDAQDYLSKQHGFTLVEK